MQLEDRDRLKTFIVNLIKTQTEADPDVLGDYIVALLDNAQGPLDAAFEASLASKLEDFLTTNTQSVVSRLVRFLCKEDGEEFPEETGQQRPAQHQAQAPLRPRALCKAWQLGHCPRGTQCRFAHPPRPVNSKRVQFGSQPVARNTRLVIESIPAEHLNIPSLHGYFGRFGTIVSIDVEPEAGRAKVEFSEASGAKSAYECPEAVFGNRFVRVLWEHEMVNKTLNLPVAVNSGLSPAAFHRPSPQEELLRRRQETLSALLEVQKQKETLLQRYLEEKSRILEALSVAESTEARSMLLNELQVVDAAIESVKPVEKQSVQGVVQPILRGGPLRSKPMTTPRIAVVRPRQSYNLDLRPKTLRMSPVPAKVGSDPASVRKFFEPYGQVSNLAIESSGGGMQAVVSYVNRRDAEKALYCLTQAEPDITITWQ